MEIFLNKYTKILLLLIVFSISVFTLTAFTYSSNNVEDVLWDEIPTTYNANYGTVFQLPVVRAKRNGFYLLAKPVVKDANNQNIEVYDYQFYVNSISNYSVYYQYEYNGSVVKSNTYSINVENNAKPIIQLPLQTEYIVKLGVTFKIPYEEVKVFLPGAKTNDTLKYDVYYGEQKVEVTNDSFVVENKGLYNVVFTASTDQGIKEERSIVVYGDDRSRDIIANFEDEYGDLDIQKFKTGERKTAYTPAELNTDPKFTRDNSKGSLKAVRNPYTVYNTLNFTPGFDLNENESVSITFWMYLDTVRTDSYVSYLRLKVSDSTPNTATSSQQIMNIYGVGSLTNMGGQWIPCTFSLDSEIEYTYPLRIELFSAGDNDSNRFSFDVYFDDFTVTPKSENIPTSFRLSLGETETEKVFDTTFIKEDLVTIAGSSDYIIKAFSALDNTEVQINSGKVVVKEDEPVILKYYLNGVQVVNTTYVYAEKNKQGEKTSYKWDGENMTSVGNNSRVYANELDVDLPAGVESVYKIAKNNTSTKPSITFGNIDLDIKNNSRIMFKIYIPETLWIPDLGVNGSHDYQSCPFGFTGMSADSNSSKPVVHAYYNGKSVESTYVSGAVYIRTSSYVGKWLDVVIDFSTTRDLDLSGLGVWFNNYHDPARGAEKDPEGYDSYILLTDMILSENNSPLISDFDIPTIKQGDTLTLDNIVIRDESSFEVYKYIEYENQIINISDKKKVTIEHTGNVKIKVIVFDEYGNYSFVEKEFIVSSH